MRQWIDLFEDTGMIREIESHRSEEFHMDEFEHHFDKSEIVWTDPNDSTTVIRWVAGIHQNMLGLFQEKNLIALLITEPYYWNPEISQIKLTNVLTSERNKGYMRLLITFYRKEFGSICSDGSNTPEAQEMWKALIRRPAGLQIVLWNSKTDEKQPAKGLPDETIWDDEDANVLLIEDVDLRSYGLGEHLLEETLRYPHHRRWGNISDNNP